jgi:DNA-binding NtrC family response regulator
LRLFRLYCWPGNVRELRNVVENMILFGASDELRVEDVPIEVRRQVSLACVPASEPSPTTSPKLKQNELAAIEAALAETGGKLAPAAKMLGISRSTLYRKMDNYGIARSARD